MKLEEFAIESAGKILLDNQLWADVKAFVSDVANHDHLSNEEKHEKVKQDIIYIFGDIGNTIINLAIALAVAWAKSVK